MNSIDTSVHFLDEIRADEVSQYGINDFDISVEYLTGGSGSIHIDALCLSSASAWAIFNPDPPMQQGFDTKRSQLERRLDAVLGVGANPHERLRMLYCSEQGVYSGMGWTNNLVARLIKDRVGDSVRLYAATSPWVDEEDQALLQDMFRDLASGFYRYSIHWDLPTRMQEVGDYWKMLYFPDDGRYLLWFAALKFRQFAGARMTLNGGPWVPFIQNHTNMYDTDAAGLWDECPLREPTAAELRLQGNLAIGYGADALMLYTFSSRAWKHATPPFWPRDEDEWVQDPTKRDENSGEIGLLAHNNLPRTIDMHGENKWDSTRAIIEEWRELGQRMRELELQWQRGRSWYSSSDLAGENQLVSMVCTQRQGEPDPWDHEDSIFVETTELLGIDDASYVFVLNGRCRDDGGRHITIKPTVYANPNYFQWKVTNVLTGDVHIVRPDSARESGTTANGFTEHFAPGAAALYRLEPMRKTIVPILPLAGHVIIDPKASLELSDQSLTFLAGKALIVEGELHASNVEFGGVDSETYWGGILVRNGGQAVLTDACRVTGGVAGVGPGSTLILEERTEFSNTGNGRSVVSVLGGTLQSSATVAEIPVDGAYVSAYYGGEAWLASDSAHALAPTSSLGIRNSGAAVSLTGVRLYEQRIGVLGTDLSETYSWASWPPTGRNRIVSNDVGLEAREESLIDFGAMTFLRNAIHVEMIDSGWHVVNDNVSQSVYADSVYWSHGPTVLSWPIPKTSGDGPISAVHPLLQDPLSFASQTTQYSKTSTGSPTPGWRQELRLAARCEQPARARQAVSSFLREHAATATLADLKEVAFWTRHENLRDARDSLYMLLLAREDLESKLLAADMALADSLYDDALEILDSYGFVSSGALLPRALLRTAAVAPLASSGGYQRGVSALDSARDLLVGDALFGEFFDLYPKYYSGLSTVSGRAAPKRSDKRLIELVLPSGVELQHNYPNPFRELTSFTFKLHTATRVSLTVYDRLGREVAIVTDGYYERGVHSVSLHAGSLSAGVYLYRLVTDDGTKHGKMLLLR